MIPIVAVSLGLFGFGLTQATILGSLTVVVFAGSMIGTARRARLAPDSRYVPFGRRAARGDGGAPGRRRYRGSKTLLAGLALAVVLEVDRAGIAEVLDGDRARLDRRGAQRGLDLRRVEADVAADVLDGRRRAPAEDDDGTDVRFTRERGRHTARGVVDTATALPRRLPLERTAAVVGQAIPAVERPVVD
ncbi:MAG: hypothetical protein ACOCSR_01265 [Wenzhouxiangella sp.]